MFSDFAHNIDKQVVEVLQTEGISVTKQMANQMTSTEFAIKNPFVTNVWFEIRFNTNTQQIFK